MEGVYVMREREGRIIEGERRWRRNNGEERSFL
jgi:hypothetical protein